MASRTPTAPPWSLAAEAALASLDARREGLSAEEAARRLERHGSNELPAEHGPGTLVVFVRQFRSSLIYILLLAGAVTILLGEYVDAGVIAAVLVLNSGIGFLQEVRAERSMAALRELARARARVLRDGRERDVDAAGLVPGDVVLVEAGARVPADCRLLHASALETDESLLTGESVPVAKAVEPVAPETAAADRANMLAMGTVATRGHGRAVVTATGPETELGRIAGSLREIAEPETPLQRRMHGFARIVGLAVLAVSIVAVALGLAAGERLDELFLTIVALAVAAIPEGLPVVLTITLAISVRRMAARRAIVRRLPAVETLGSCTAIGSDKTGTLTENRMTVRRLVTADGGRYDVTGGSDDPAGSILAAGRAVAPERDSPLGLTLVAGTLCNDASAVEVDGRLETTGDPTETALLVAAAKAGLARDELEDDLPRVAEIPFDPERRYAVTVNRAGNGRLVFAKGAPEAVLALCGAAYAGTPLDRSAVLAEADRLAEEGLRVLAMAYAEIGPGQHVDVGPTVALPPLRFVGLQAMLDPPRAEAADAVRGCQRAGIRVVMITGDHAATGLAIARMLGIAGPEARVLTGAELDSVDNEELRRVVAEVPVFARVSPQHKLRLVTALQKAGETVAVTGDGVNDAPALRAADIGAAMGRSGTDVAKEAADIVIADDNFATVFAAVAEGRVAFDNVRKTTFFLVSSGVASVLAVLASLAFRFQLPFLPAQLLWLNLVTNGVQDVALAFEPGEKDVLERRPRARREGVISALLWERTLLAGVVMAAGTLLLFLRELDAGASDERARTVALTTMVLFQVFHVGNSRSEYLSAFRKSPFSNRFLFVGTAAALAIHAGALYLPFTQFVLRVEPLDLRTWAQMAVVASTVIVAVELHKFLRSRDGWAGRRRREVGQP